MDMCAAKDTVARNSVACGLELAATRSGDVRNKRHPPSSGWTDGPVSYVCYVANAAGKNWIIQLERAEERRPKKVTHWGWAECWSMPVIYW